MEPNSFGQLFPGSSSWSDFATISVIKFKCKFCKFETEDLPALKRHNEDDHLGEGGTERPVRVSGSESDEQPGTGTEWSTDLGPPPSTSRVTKATRVQILPPTQHKVEAGVQSPSSEIYLCSECNVTFESEALCYEHMSFEHGLEEFNGEIISDESREETKPLPLAPPFPRMKSKRKSRQPQLMTLEGGGVVVPKKFRKDLKTKCTLCRAKFEQEEILQIHQQCHNRKENIPHARNPDNPDEDDQHPKTVLGYSCIICKLSNGNANTESKNGHVEADCAEIVKFCKWGQCAIHLWRKHNIDCELYQCPQCPFKSYAKATLAEHENIHGVASKFKCKTCHKAFKQLSQLKNHEKYHKEKSTKLPPPGEERWFTPKVCPVCSRVLSDQKCLKRHIAYVHNKLKQHVCNICGHLSARKAELQLHMRQHTGERPHKCPFCSFATIDPSSLRRHKLRHTENYTYSCTHCDYKCIQTNQFKLHMKTTHPGEEGIFKCSLCPFESVNSTLFEAHLKGHADSDNDRDSKNTSSDAEALNLNESSCTSTSNATDTDASVNANDNEEEDQERTPTSALRRRQIYVRTKSWLQEESSGDGDVDSSGNVETEGNPGGITIPAPAPTPRSEG